MSMARDRSAAASAAIIEGTNTKGIEMEAENGKCAAILAELESFIGAISFTLLRRVKVGILLRG